MSTYSFYDLEQKAAMVCVKTILEKNGVELVRGISNDFFVKNRSVWIFVEKEKPDFGEYALPSYSKEIHSEYKRYLIHPEINVKEDKIEIISFHCFEHKNKNFEKISFSELIRSEKNALNRKKVFRTDTVGVIGELLVKIKFEMSGIHLIRPEIGELRKKEVLRLEKEWEKEQDKILPKLHDPYEWMEKFNEITNDFNNKLKSLRKEEFGVGGTKGLPDFMVKGKKIMIEVKTGKQFTTSSKQREVFPLLIKKRWRIFFIKPEIKVLSNALISKGYECKEYLDKRTYTHLSVKQLMEICKCSN